jgi:polysaccharide pyruvyl transferase WcaK-like protein
MRRRDFLRACGCLVAASAMPGLFAAEPARPRRLLLRSSWQTVNIGDIGHSPGVIQLLTDLLPQVEVTLWPSNIGDGVEEMLRAAFPRLRIAKGSANAETGAVNSDELKAAFADCDALLHGSGPSLVAAAHVAAWRKGTGKPYGVYGITLGQMDAGLKATLDHARFVYLRDSISVQYAKDQGIASPIVDFTPDGAFACRLRNDAAATAFLRANGLEDGRFVCVIPRLRNSPYWAIHHRPMKEADQAKHASNEKNKERDHVKLREAVIAVVRRTGLKVLLCPEDKSHMGVGKEMIYDQLPGDVKAQVVWRENYWLTDEAISTYARAAFLMCMDMHSPIMAVGNGIPAIHCRFREQTSKGQMWKDIGLGDWLFDFDVEQDGSRLTAAALAIAADLPAARTKTAAAAALVRRKHQESMTQVAAMLGI